jgi:hypothetical protein
MNNRFAFLNESDDESIKSKEKEVDKIQCLDINFIKKFQPYIKYNTPTDTMVFTPCNGYCCNGEEEFYRLDNYFYDDIVTKGMSRLQHLMESKIKTIPFNEAEIVYACDFENLLPLTTNNKSEIFLDHNVINVLSEVNVTLKTWLTFNTGMKTINRKNGKEENLKLFITTYDEFINGHDLSFLTEDVILDMNETMNNLKRDLFILENSTQKFSKKIKDELINDTKHKIRTLQHNNIVEITKRIKMFMSFDDARSYIKQHYGKVKKI